MCALELQEAKERGAALRLRAIGLWIMTALMITQDKFEIAVRVKAASAVGKTVAWEWSADTAAEQHEEGKGGCNVTGNVT